MQMQKGFDLILYPPQKLPTNAAVFAFLDRHLLNRLDKIVGDLFRHNAVMLVAWVVGHELADPFRTRPQRAICAFADQIKIGCKEAPCLDIDVDAVEI